MQLKTRFCYSRTGSHGVLRIKFIKDHKQYKKGDVETFSPNEAFGYIDSGIGMISKDMVESDTITTQARPTYKPKKTRRFNIKEK